MPFRFAGRVVDKYVDDECPMMAAGLAFYAVFSIPPLLFVLINGAGMLFGTNAAEQGLTALTRRLLGPSAAMQFSEMLRTVTAQHRGEGAALAISLVALLFAATGSFVQLRSALNRVWGVRHHANRPMVISYFARRIASIGMMAVFGLFLLASLGLSTLLVAAGEMFLVGPREDVLHFLDLTFNIAVFTLLFVVMFRWIPDAKVPWRDVWVGAAATTALFLATKYGAAAYLGRGDGGSLTVFMLWVYFAAAALLLGAEFTCVWVERRGRTIEPEAGAVRVTVTRGEPKERQERFTRLDI
jgi:membrane protein